MVGMIMDLRLLRTLLLAAFMLPGLLWGEGPTPFKVSGDKTYEPVSGALTALVRQKATVTLNHLCAVGYRNPDGSTYAWVYWREGKALILWEPHVAGSPAKALSASRRYLQLDRDAVANTDQLKGSTYKITQEWVHQITRECELYGERFEISEL